MNNKPELPLNLFVDLGKISNIEHFKDSNVFSYLGDSLKVWLENLLNDLGVTSEPVIHGHVEEGAVVRGRVYIAKGAVVEPGAFITGPCYIGDHAEVRHGAYIRGQVYVGARAVVGHTSEIKGSVLFDKAKAAHFAYVGDSILGYDVNLGAGTKLANLKLQRSEVKYLHPETDRVHSSGLKKFGAIMGDSSQTGCNSVLSPGTLLLPKTGVMPCYHYHGTLKQGFVG